jgi:hypothetical protein
VTLPYASHLGEQKATSMTVNRNLTTMSTAGLLLPIASASSSGKLEDGPEHYQHGNRTPSLPFSQSQTQSQSQPLVFDDKRITIIHCRSFDATK